MTEDELHGDIELAIIRWVIDNTRTAGSLTREIMLMIKQHEMEKVVFGELVERIKNDIDS